MNKLTRELIRSSLNESSGKIKKIVAIYPGRFQPFGPHHKKTYEWLKSKFGDAYLTTSNKVQLPKSPMNFKEKARHIVKMGIPKSRIYLEPVPYIANNLLKKFDPETTAVIYIFGTKDAGRLISGTKKNGELTYYQDYNKNKNNLEGYEKHGYILTAPHTSIKISGKEVSGTVMRELLGSPKYSINREKLFKQAFGYFDKGIFNMMHNKFKSVFQESIIKEEKIKFRSAGIIPYIKINGEPKYLLLYDGHNWGFPKGHVEQGETDLKAAIRETFEECGIKINKVKSNFKQQSVYYVKKNYVTGEKLKTPAKKLVTYFLGETLFQNVKLSFEHKAYRWVTYKEGLKLLKFGSEILKSANIYIKLTTEVIGEFLTTIDMKKIIKENTSSGDAPVDDGPPTFYKTFSEYKNVSTSWLNSIFQQAGWKVINYILSSGAEDPEIDYTMSYNIVPAVVYGKSGDGVGYSNPLKKYKERIQGVVGTLGWKIIDWLGTHGKGVEVEAPPTAGADDESENTDNMLKKLGLLDEVNSVLDKVERELLVEGGAYGHMSHPFDDKDLTFKDLKTIIERGLNGTLNREDNVSEKLDGQNIMVSWKNGKLIAARNKGHIKNGGKTALDFNGISSKFKGRGNIRDAFVFAMKDLQNAIKGLSDKQKNKIFDNGHNFMNLEILWPNSANVIDYDVAQLVFHGALKYDADGNVIGEIPGSARILEGMIRQINAGVQSKYTIGKPQFLTIPKHQDFGQVKSKYIARLNKLQNEYALKDSDTLATYHQKFWEEFIYNAAKQYKYKISSKVLQGLVQRWAFFNKKYSISNMKSDIRNKDFLEWALLFDKQDHLKYVKQNMLPFESLFFEVGAEIMKNITGWLAVNPNKTVQRIRSKLKSAISDVKSGGDLKKLNILKQQLNKLNKIGGIDAIMPSEGVVFKYNGKTYKFTGAFASINQIVGLMTF